MQHAQPRKNDAWLKASGQERRWTAVACLLSSLTFSGPGVWLSGRPVQGCLFFAGELILVGFWLMLAGLTAGWPLLSATVMLAVYHLACWLHAARCGWYFRRGIGHSHLSRILVMAGAITLAPLPALFLAYGPAQRYLLAEYQVSEASMATTLLGQHANLRCRNCQYRFSVGLSPYQSDAPLPQEIHCPMCNSLNFERIQADYSPADRVLTAKRLSPRRWDLLTFRSPANLNTMILKRLVGLGGEELQIIDGDIFINGSIISKPPLDYEPMWLPVADTSFQAQSDAGPRLYWRSEADTQAWLNHGQSWKFDSATDSEQSLELMGQLNDRLSYNINPLHYIKTEPIHDVRLGLCLAEFSGPGPLSLLWQRGQTRVRGTVHADGQASLAIQTRGSCTSSDIQISHLGQKIPPDATIMLIVRDGLAYLYAAGQQLCRKPLGPLDARSRLAGRNPPHSPRLSITARNCRLRISRIRLDRDVHYQSLQSAPSTADAEISHTKPVKIPPGHYYLLGDNSPVSSDSRLGWGIHPSLQADTPPGVVPARLTEGVVTCVYWPLARWRSFR